MSDAEVATIIGLLTLGLSLGIGVALHRRGRGDPAARVEALWVNTAIGVTVAVVLAGVTFIVVNPPPEPAEVHAAELAAHAAGELPGRFTATVDADTVSPDRTIPSVRHDGATVIVATRAPQLFAPDRCDIVWTTDATDDQVHTARLDDADACAADRAAELLDIP